MIPILLRVLCTKRSDSSSPPSGSAPKGLDSHRVAAGHRARPESPRGRTCKAPGRAQAPSGSATRLSGADRGAPAPASNSRVRSRSLPESSEPSIDRGSGSVSSKHFARRRSNVYGRPWLRAQNVNAFHVNDTSKVIAMHRWDVGGPGDDVVIVFNFGNQAYSSYELGFPRSGTWRVRFNSDAGVYDAYFGNWPT